METPHVCRGREGAGRTVRVVSDELSKRTAAKGLHPAGPVPKVGGRRGAACFNHTLVSRDPGAQRAQSPEVFLEEAELGEMS